MPNLSPELWNLALSFVAGMLAQRGLSHLRAWQLNRRDPLPDGKRRHAAKLDTKVVSRLIAVVFVVWSVYVTQSTQNEQKRLAAETRQFALEVQDCQKQFNEALKARSALTAENDKLSLQQRELLVAAFDAQNSWLSDLLAPKRPEIAALDVNDPVRAQYGLDRTSAYFDQLDHIRAELNTAKDEQLRIDNARRNHPLPEPTCGK